MFRIFLSLLSVTISLAAHSKDNFVMSKATAGIYSTVCSLLSTNGTPHLDCQGMDKGEVLNVPSEIQGLEISEFDMSRFVACVLIQSKAKCWGESFSLKYMPADWQDKRFTKISVGEFHTCGITEDRNLSCWGRNNAGETVVPQGYEWLDVKVLDGIFGGEATCAITTKSEVKCWGDDRYEVVSFEAKAKGVRALEFIGREDALACVRTPDHFLCSGSDEIERIPKRQEIGALSVIDVNLFTGCGFGKKGIICWNDRWKQVHGGGLEKLPYAVGQVESLPKDRAPLAIYSRTDYLFCFVYSDQTVCKRIVDDNNSKKLLITDKGTYYPLGKLPMEHPFDPKN